MGLHIFLCIPTNEKLPCVVFIVYIYLGTLGPLWAPLWAPLGPLWDPLGPLWAPLGPLWAPLGTCGLLLGCYGALLGLLWAPWARIGQAFVGPLSPYGIRIRGVAHCVRT